MLSQTVDGDYIVRKVLVVNQDDADYSIRYQINLATLNAMLNGNSKELDELNAFVGYLMSDSLKQVQSVTITGYASPDGPVAFNKSLAARRANDFKTYVDKKYDFSKKFNVTVNSVAEDWKAAAKRVEESSMSDRRSVLDILDGSRTEGQKELALKKMPAAWNYLKKNILPPMRRVELKIDYAAGNIVEQRLLIPCPAPEPQPAPKPCCCVVVDDVVNGIIVEMPDEHEYRKEMREESRAMRQDVRGVDKYAKKEAREAQKIVRQQEKAAKKIAKKEAKAAKKAEKAARKTYKELEKM